jgi:diguanylate cyclase (GGDEF)-like protein
VFFVVLAGMCLVQWIYGFDGSSAGMWIYLLGVLLGIGYSIRAATHPLLDPRIRRPWRYLAAVFCLDIVIGASTLPITQGTDLARVQMSPLLMLGIVGLAAQAIFLVGALLSFAAMPLAGRAGHKLAMDVLIVVGAALMVLWYVLIWPVVSGHQSSLSPVVMIYDCAMLLSDLASVVGISTVVLRGTLPAVRAPARLVLTSLVGFLGWDMWTIWSQLHPALALPAITSQLIVTVPLFVMVAAAVEQCRGSRSDLLTTPYDSGVQRPSSLPYVALTIGFAVQVTAAVRNGGLPWLGLVAGGVVMTFGVAMRQHVSLRENYAIALTDPLTGLANRVQLRTTLGTTMSDNRRTGVVTAVMVIDLNGFKLVNDTHGHETGDELLVVFANLLRRVLRKTDVPARWGGDEFVVVLNGIEGIHDATWAAERLLAEIRNPVVVNGRQITIRASIGIATSDLDGPDTAWEDLLREADHAMYRAKRLGGSGWQVYSRDWQAEMPSAGGPPTAPVDNPAKYQTGLPFTEPASGQPSVNAN